MSNEELALRIQEGERELFSLLWERVERLIRQKAGRFYRERQEQCAACGFAGLQWHEEGLSLQNSLPAAWKRLSFHAHWRGANLKITLTPGELKVENVSGPKVDLILNGKKVQAAQGETVTA